MQSYLQLEKVFSEYTTLKNLHSLVQWDSAVYLPPKSAKSRAKQIALIDSYMANCLNNRSVKKHLAKANTEQNLLTKAQAANLREMNYHILIRTTIPKKLSQNLASATAIAQSSWVNAKTQSDFKILAPALSKVVTLVRKKAQILSDVLECSPYEALIHEHDPNRKLAEINPLFEQLKQAIPSLMERRHKKSTPSKGDSGADNLTATQIQSNNIHSPYSTTKIVLDVATQKKIIHQIASDFGFSFEKGRIDETEHPFTEGNPDDVRIAIKYKEDDLLFTVNSFLHEFGHAVYDFSLPNDWEGQPIAYDRGMTIHEGIALFYEMFIGKSFAFAHYLYRLLKNAASLPEIASPEHLFELLNQPNNSGIRIEADALSYLNHIILRFEMELELVSGELEVAQIPERWQLLSKQLLGKATNSDAEGCLQDIHWSMGLFGYFPCYGLGLIAAGQLYDYCKRENEIDLQEFNHKSISSIRASLTDLVFQHGARFPSVDQLFKHHLGMGLNSSGLISCLKER